MLSVETASQTNNLFPGWLATIWHGLKRCFYCCCAVVTCLVEQPLVLFFFFSFMKLTIIRSIIRNE